MAAPVSAPSKEDVVAEFRRRSIIQAACHVFGEKGFEPATVDAIAEAAHVAKGTVYLYYPSKQAIYDAVYASGMADLERGVAQSGPRQIVEHAPAPFGPIDHGEDFERMRLRAKRVLAH